MHRRVSVATAHVHTGQVEVDITRVRVDAPPADGAPVHSLDDALRPALARISARISALVPRVPGGLERESLRREARAALASTGLEAQDIDRLADALGALGGAPSPPAAGR